MNTDTSDNAAIQFLLTTEAGNESNTMDPETLAYSIVVGAKMWREAALRGYSKGWTDCLKQCHDKG